MNNLEIQRRIQEQQILFSRKDPGKRRDVFNKVVKTLEINDVTIISGIRRVGKTTLMKQLYNHLLKQKVPQDKIFFFSFDEHTTRNEAFLSDLLQVIAPVNDTSKKYIFLDEIQHVPFWQGVIKKYVDFYPNIKIVVSGSSTLFIKKKMNDSLAGRTSEIHVEELSFIEFLEISKGINLKGFNIQSFLDNPEDIYKEIKEIWAANSKEFISHFKEYQFFGQFPETNKYSTIEEKYKYINESIYKKLIEEDIPQLYDIENTLEFNRLFRICVQDTGNFFQVYNLAGELGISVNTLKDYFRILTEAYLVNDILSFRKSIQKQARTAQKIYVASTNFYAAMNNLNVEFEINSVLGHMLETSIFNLLKRKFHYNFFYIKNQREIDFISTDDPMLKNIIPIEVKYKENIDNNDYSFLTSFMQKRNVDNGIILSLGLNKINPDSDKTLWVLPSPIFL